ncbi:MAG TPA: hypothetical protein VIH59_13910 [Candidatus Tectomicrobia bacterium]
MLPVQRNVTPEDSAAPGSTCSAAEDTIIHPLQQHSSAFPQADLFPLHQHLDGVDNVLMPG